MSGDFLDSNVLLYIMDRGDSGKRRTARDLVERAITDGTGQISTQVVHETLNVLSGKAAAPLGPADTVSFYESTLLPLWKVQPTDATFRSAVTLKSRYQLHFYDALIVAAALQAGCARLVSEDFQHGQRFESLLVHNPFL